MRPGVLYGLVVAVWIQCASLDPVLAWARCWLGPWRRHAHWRRTHMLREVLQHVLQLRPAVAPTDEAAIVLAQRANRHEN